MFLLFCYIFKEDVRFENKENQWMGVTVQSQGPGGKIVVSQTERLNSKLMQIHQKTLFVARSILFFSALYINQLWVLH